MREVTSDFNVFFSDLRQRSPLRVFLRNDVKKEGIFSGLSPDIAQRKIFLRVPGSRLLKQEIIPINDIQKVQVLN